MSDAFTVETYADEQTWLSKRGIGATDAAAIMGLNPYVSPLGLWARMRGLDTAAIEESEPMRWGKRLEAPIADEFADRTGAVLIDHGRFTIHRSKALPWLTCSLDREITSYDAGEGDLGRGVLEIKAVGSWQKEEWVDEAPVVYAAQIQSQLAVTQWKYGVACALVSGQSLAHHVVPRHDEFISLLIEKCEEFRHYLESDTPPPLVDGTAATAEALKRLYPRDRGGEVALPGDAIDWDEQLEAAKAAIKMAEAKKLEAENRIKAAIGEASIGHVPGGIKYSFKAQTRAAYVADVAECTYRVLRRSAAKR